ncbi:MAG: hypothetical protein AAFQ90_07765 [Pseudomonadota bacterium]
MYYLRAYGQLVASELALPEFEPISNAQDTSLLQPDLRIKLRALPNVPIEERNAGIFRVRDGVVDFEIADTVRIRVASAECIEVDLLDATREREARLFVTGSAFGAWVFLTGRIPFHCGLVTKAGRGFAITGPSGAGKSTLTTALVERGFGFMSDDVVVLDRAPEGAIAITPSFPRIKLWGDAARHLRVHTKERHRLHRDLDKFHVPFSPAQVTEKATLGAVFRLRFDDGCTSPDCRRLPLPEAMRELRSNIYRPALVPALGLEQNAFTLVADILREVPVLDFVRPSDLTRLKASAEAFERVLADL